MTKVSVVKRQENNGIVVLHVSGNGITLEQLQRVQKEHLTGKLMVYADVFSGMPLLRIQGKLKKRSTLRADL